MEIKVSGEWIYIWDMKIKFDNEELANEFLLKWTLERIRKDY